MSTRESAAFTRLKRGILFPGDRVERVENGISEGMFDVNYCIAGREGWLEIKAPLVPKRPDTQLLGGGHGILLSQANWALKQQKAFGRCYLYVATVRASMLLPASMIVDYEATNRMSLRELSARSLWLAVGRNITPDQWARLRRMLCV